MSLGTPIGIYRRSNLRKREEGSWVKVETRLLGSGSLSETRPSSPMVVCTFLYSITLNTSFPLYILFGQTQLSL